MSKTAGWTTAREVTSRGCEVGGGGSFVAGENWAVPGNVGEGLFGVCGIWNGDIALLRKEM